MTSFFGLNRAPADVVAYSRSSRIRHARLTLCASFALLLAACSTGPSVKVDSTTSIPDAGVAALDGPLVVPALSALPDTPARVLAGKFVPAGYNDLPGWASDDLRNVWTTFVRNCRGLMRPTSGNLAASARSTPRAWQPVCAAAADPARAPNPKDPESVRRFIQTWLGVWRLQGSDGKSASNTVTGYYEPLVMGSRKKGGPHQWPLYTVPADLLTIDLGKMYPELAGKRVRGKLDGNRVVPYDSRAALETSGRQPPAVVFVNDPVDNFFLQVQGSGRVQLVDGPDSGQTIRVAYADHNGHPYVSIGKWLADKNELPLAQTSMQNIREWAKRNPKRVQEMLNANPALVFFREELIVDPEIGPKGAFGIPLMAQRSIAVDTTFVPLGAPVFLATTQPASTQPLNRLVFAQDTGTAIKGPARADFYWGFGEAAGNMAGRMKQSGQMWVLWPKQAGAPSAR
jgi:membrane-bound lytic murein transglycosylase A